MSTDRGDALFVEEDYEGAIAVYSATIIAGSDTLRANLSREPDGGTLRALVHRSVLVLQIVLVGLQPCQK